MDSDDDMLYDEDSGNEMGDEEHEDHDEEDDDFVDMGMEPEPSTQEKHEGEEYPFEVLTADQIVQHMVDCIREVNSVIQVICCLCTIHVHLCMFLHILGKNIQHYFKEH